MNTGELFRAIVSNNLIRVRALLDGGVNPNIGDFYRQPLGVASHYGHLEIVNELLQAGANPNIFDGNARTPLWYASEHGRLEIVKILLSYGADPNIMDMYNLTPLQWAKSERRLNVVNLLKNYYLSSLKILAIRSIRRYRIDIEGIPKELFSS